jgi:hypothetical protein
MTWIQIIRLLHLVSYLVVTSQLLFYLVILSDAMKIIPLSHFLEQRKAVDSLMVKRFKVIYVSCLLLNIVVVILAAGQPLSACFISAVIALVCVIVDTSISQKGNTPLNQLVNSYVPEDNSTDWELVRVKWLRLIRYRGIFTGVVID